MGTPDTSDLILSLILYVMLPLWGIAGFIDWACHRHTHIERTSGVKESFIHLLMGAQVGAPIILCLIFEVNILLLFVIFLVLITHELVAHWDVHFTAPRREISIWEVHMPITIWRRFLFTSPRSYWSVNGTWFSNSSTLNGRAILH